MAGKKTSGAGAATVPGQMATEVTPAGETVVSDSVPPPQEIWIRGAQQGSLDVGGKRAQSAQISFTGAKALVEGRFAKGDRIVFQAVAVIRQAGSKDKVDKPTGQVTDAIDVYVAEVQDLAVLTGDDPPTT